MLGKRLDIIPAAAMTGASAVVTVILGGRVLEALEPRTRGIPVIGPIISGVRAAWNQVYNP